MEKGTHVKEEQKPDFLIFLKKSKSKKPCAKLKYDKIGGGK